MKYFSNPYLKILDEIAPSPNYIPKKEEYVAWCKRHKKLMDTKAFSGELLVKLFHSFKEIEELVGFLEYEPTIILANDRFLHLDQENEVEVLEWLLDFEKISEIAEHFYASHFEWSDDKVEGDKIIISQELGIKIELSDFESFIVFEKSFRPLLLQKQEKFITDDFDPRFTSLQTMLEFHEIIDFCGVDIYIEELDRFNSRNTNFN
ncbi:hypothetical protein [uncultured Flavobacterium sp.]|uniref:hypothetical protein n=1 Tax=uncultured Flavobacterium sp. TaxID=165435 RepID=UPI00259661D2|nr:hypothetical protein [uncultured Flavobacterium sp.]